MLGVVAVVVVVLLLLVLLLLMVLTMNYLGLLVRVHAKPDVIFSLSFRLVPFEQTKKAA